MFVWFPTVTALQAPWQACRSPSIRFPVADGGILVPIPGWFRDGVPAFPTFNARIETALDMSTFRDATRVHDYMTGALNSRQVAPLHGDGTGLMYPAESAMLF